MVETICKTASTQNKMLQFLDYILQTPCISGATFLQTSLKIHIT